MRLRVGVFLCLLASYLGIGCRQPLTPNADRNQAPETWITAAPFDTITVKDKFGHPVERPRPGTIPVRFHVYWAGSDRDGAVAGFYWAVVETLPRPPAGDITVPNLPGPKPRDYHFTTKTDSFFIFTVAEDIPDRQHAFFIYAVDNHGKADPTPARFIFNAQDRFPPVPIFEDCTCTGTVYSLKPGGRGVIPRDTTYFITDIDYTDINRRGIPPRDTCPSGSVLLFKWHAQPTIPQTIVTGFRYKLDEPRFIEVGPEVRSVTYTSGVATGTKVFVLRAVDQAFGTRDSTRRFEYNFAPDTWFSGPDPQSPSLLTKPNGEKYAVFSPIHPTPPHLPPGGIRESLMSPDSTLLLPAERPERKTFFEIWKDTLFVRQEDDTVHMNSWVVIHSGGFDRDSPYRVGVSELARNLPDFPGGIVLDPDSANGSPVGVRSWQVMSLTPQDYRSSHSATGVYPIFDPNDVFHAPRIGGYHPMIQAGRAFLLAFAVDGDGTQDRRVQDPRELVLRYEARTADEKERLLRSKVMTFHVNRPPYFVTESPLFFPRLGVVDTFKTSTWGLRLVGADEDPFLPNTPVGRPSTTVTLRRTITVRGQNASGEPFVYRDPARYLNQTNISVTVPSALAPGPCTLEIELCDCATCEDHYGSGRCRTLSIPVYYDPSSPQRTTSQALGRPGTGELPR